MQEFHRSRVNCVIQNNEWRIKLRRERKSIQIERKKDLIQSAKEKGVLSRCRITFHRVSKVSPSFIPSLRRVWVRTVTILLHFFFPSTRPARIQIKDPLPPLDTTLPSFISFPLSLISQRSAATRGSFLQFHQRGLWTFLPGPRGSDLINLFTTLWIV